MTSTLELSETHRLLRDSVFQFARNEVAPLVDEMEQRGEPPPHLFPRLGELGLLGVTVPEEYGGSGLDLLATVLCTEQLARASGSLALSYAAHANLCADNLYRNGNEDQRRRYLPGLCAGSSVGALALTEPEAGSDALGLQMAARRDGDDYVLTGTKMFITNGPIADVFITYARVDSLRGSRGSQGITAFIVERSFPGFSVSRRLRKFGHWGSPTAELAFQDCRVPATNVLGGEGGGAAIMMSGLDRERIAVAGEPLGLATEALELSLHYARERKQFGQPIGEFQMIQAKLADMYTQTEAARWLVYRTATRADAGEEVHRDAAACLLFAAEVATRVCLDAMQIHGGYGYLEELPLGRLVRDAKLLEIGAGTSEIRRRIIARELLR